MIVLLSQLRLTEATDYPQDGSSRLVLESFYETDADFQTSGRLTLDTEAAFLRDAVREAGPFHLVLIPRSRGSVEEVLRKLEAAFVVELKERTSGP